MRITSMHPPSYKICLKLKIFTTKCAKKTTFKNYWTWYLIRKIDKINKVKTLHLQFLILLSNSSMTSIKRILIRGTEIVQTMMMISTWELQVTMRMIVLKFQC